MCWKRGTSVLSTAISIDAGTDDSEDSATPAVISDSAIAARAKLTFSLSGVGSTTAGAGLKLWLFGYRSI